MIILKSTDEGVQEYQSLLDQLDEEAEQIKVDRETGVKREKEIKAQVGEILDNLGEKDTRVAIAVRSGRAWDRRISLIGAGLDPSLLEEEIGVEAYKKLCARTVTYQLDANKIEESRMKGKLTEETLLKVTSKGTPSPSYYRPLGKTLKEQDDD